MKTFDINKLRITSPCPVSWTEMTGNDRTRHCYLCELDVHNVAGMTRNEVSHLVNEANGRLCMRLVRRADGTVLTKDCPVGIIAYRKRVAGLASAALATILGLFSISFGQQDEKSTMTVRASNLEIVRSPAKNRVASLSGTLVDLNGAVIPGFKVSMQGPKSGVWRTVSDEDGRFLFPRLERGVYEIRVEGALGFQSLIVTGIEVSRVEAQELRLTLEAAATVLMGDIVFVGTEELDRTNNSPAIELNPKKPLD